MQADRRGFEYEPFLVLEHGHAAQGMADAVLLALALLARHHRDLIRLLRATSYVVVFVGELELHRQGSSRTGSVLCWLANADSTCVHSPAIWISG